MPCPRRRLNVARSDGDPSAIEILETLVNRLGVANVIGLLADIATRRSEEALVSGDHLKAGVSVHQASVLDRAVTQLDGD